MASALKHAKRSQKTLTKNYSQYRSFVMKAASKGKTRKEKKSISERIFAKIGRLFKHQSK